MVHPSDANAEGLDFGTNGKVKLAQEANFTQTDDEHRSKQDTEQYDFTGHIGEALLYINRAKFALETLFVGYSKTNMKVMQNAVLRIVSGLEEASRRTVRIGKVQRNLNKPVLLVDKEANTIRRVTGEAAFRYREAYYDVTEDELFTPPDDIIPDDMGVSQLT